MFSLDGAAGLPLLQGDAKEGEGGEDESAISSLLQATHLADGALAETLGAGGLTEEVAAQLRLQIDERLRAAADGVF